MMDFLHQILFFLTTGSYGYTFLATKNRVRKQDIDDLKAQCTRLENRIDSIYKLLVAHNGKTKDGKEE